VSLLDDVRIAATRYDNLRTRWVLGPNGEGALLVCVGCGQPLNDHDPDCLFVLLPKIVAALEAAQDVVQQSVFHLQHTDDDQGHYYECPHCDQYAPCDCTERENGFEGIKGAVVRVAPTILHDEQCPMQNLVQALRPE
jgi:hypothetical protein